VTAWLLVKFVILQLNVYGVRPPVVADPVNVHDTGPLPGATHGGFWISIRASSTPMVVVVDAIVVVVAGAVVVVAGADVVDVDDAVGVLPPQPAPTPRTTAMVNAVRPQVRTAFVRARFDPDMAESSLEISVDRRTPLL
jgi:hypothetical protein